jgi:hypothetical protein
MSLCSCQVIGFVLTFFLKHAQGRIEELQEVLFAQGWTTLRQSTRLQVLAEECKVIAER